MGTRSGEIQSNPSFWLHLLLFLPGYKWRVKDGRRGFLNSPLVFWEESFFHFVSSPSLPLWISIYISRRFLVHFELFLIKALNSEAKGLITISRATEWLDGEEGKRKSFHSLSIDDNAKINVPIDSRRGGGWEEDWLGWVVKTADW